MRRWRFVPIAVFSSVMQIVGCRSLTLPTTPPVTEQATPAPVMARVTPRIVPLPSSLTESGGAPFVLTATTAITVDGGDAEGLRIGEMLAAILRPSTGFPVLVRPTSASAAGAIRMRLAADRSPLGEDGYDLLVTSDSVLLVAYRPAGLFHGTQTIRQMLPPDVESHVGFDKPWPIAAVRISDQPRYSWRGSMLDPGRHFLTVDEVKQFIDMLALYKMNILHLHLTDDQGWRIEIKSHPKLALVGGLSEVAGGPGGFYTQADYTDIVRYAQARFITIVPEIEMPGHSGAALTAYPELSCSSRAAGQYIGTEVGWSTMCPDKEGTYALIDDVVREVAAITPGPWFHIGGDEVATLVDSQYVKFITRVQDIVTRRGKIMVGWEEISKAKLRPTTISQQWKSDSVAAALQSGAKVLLSPATKVYLDMKYTPNTELGLAWAAIVEVRDAYDWNPATLMPGLTESSIVGVEAPVWGETVRNIGAVNFLAFPRLPAIAEVAWTPQAARDWGSFRTRIATHAPRWRYMGVNYYPSPQVPW